VYGVKIAGSPLAIDNEATAALRKTMS